MSGISELSFNFLTGNIFITVLFLVLFIIFSVWLYRRTNPPLSRPVRFILTALRLVAILALFLALFEPVLSYRREYERKPRLTLLLDRSGSMDLKEGEPSRFDKVEELISSNRFNRFLDNFEVNRRYFSDSVAGSPAELNFDQTALGEALQSLADRQLGQPSDAWILFSDGISNSGVTPLEVAPELDMPVHTIGFGEITEDKDIALEGLDYNNVVFAGKPTELTVHLSWHGMNNQPARIEIRSGTKIMSSETVRLGQGTLMDNISLKFTPERPGQQTYETVIQPVGDEITIANNSRSFSMTVLKSRMQVLLVTEQLDWEFAFLNRFLLNNETVELNQVIGKKGSGNLEGSFPSRQEDLNRYDLLILYDIDPQNYRSKQPLIESYLNEKGGGMLIILGDNYLESDFPRWIDDYLPFVVTRDRARMLYVKYNGRPMENYLFHPAVRISDNRQDIREAWSNLPHFEALIPIDSITPNSEMLVVSDLSTEKNLQPIIGLKNFRGGKVLATAAMPFWHWAFFGYGFGTDDREYRLFFDGVVNWLGTKAESDPVRIVPDKDIYTRGEEVGFTAFAYDLGFRPIKGASGHIVLIDEDQNDTTVAQLVETGEGRYRTEFEVVPPGRYKYNGMVEKEGRTLKESSGRLAVESYSIEEFRRRPDFDLLSTVSRLTGGEFYTPENIDSIYGNIDTSKILVAQQNEIVLWDKVWLLIIFIVALGTEWLIRKRYQLI